MVPALLLSAHVLKLLLPLPPLFISDPDLNSFPTRRSSDLLNPLSSCSVQVPLLLIVGVPPACPTEPPDIVALPCMLSVRVSVSGFCAAPENVSVAPTGTVVVPAPLICPDVQLSALLTLTVP